MTVEEIVQRFDDGVAALERIADALERIEKLMEKELRDHTFPDD